MFRIYLICLVFTAATAAVASGAVAKAGGTSPVIATAAAKTKARTDAVSAPAPKTPADKDARPTASAPNSGNARHDTAKTDEADSRPTAAVKLSGESVVGDQNAPKSLVLVPWKSAQIGKMPGLSMLLDDSVRPVDRDVFMRELAYYRIRTAAK